MYDKYAQTGVEPKALELKPIISAHLEEYIRAFNILSTRRQVGMSKNPITLSEILQYMDSFGCTEPEIFVLHIIRMDLAYLEHVNKADK